MSTLIFIPLNKTPYSQRFTAFQVISEGEPVGLLRDNVDAILPPNKPRAWSWHPYHMDAAFEVSEPMTVTEIQKHLEDAVPRELANRNDRFQVYAYTAFGFRYALTLEGCSEGLFAASARFVPITNDAAASFDADSAQFYAHAACKAPLPASAVRGDRVVRIQAVSIHTGHKHDLMRSEVRGVATWTPLKGTRGPRALPTPSFKVA